MTEGVVGTAAGRIAPSLASLRLVEAAARHRSYSGAGREVGVSHSAISQQIGRLEKDWGVRLFTKVGVVMTPTPAAIELAQAYLKASRIVQDSVRRVVGDSEPPPLVVSLPASMARPWLRHRMIELNAAVPDVRVEVHGDQTAPDFDHVDVAVLSGPGMPRGMKSMHLFDQAVTPVCSPGFRDAHDLNDPDRLRDVRVLVHDEECWAQWLAAAGVDADWLLRGPVFDDPALVLDAAMDGHGVSLACRVSVSRELEMGRLIQPFEICAPTSRRFSLAWPHEHARRELVHNFADWMKQQIGMA